MERGRQKQNERDRQIEIDRLRARQVKTDGQRDRQVDSSLSLCLSAP